MGLTRRVLIAGGGTLLVGTAAAAGGSLVFCQRRRTRAAALPLERLDVALLDIRAPDRICQALREASPPAALEEAFLRRADLLEVLRLDCDATRRGALRMAVREDFRRGDILVADRLIVARSEALIAALRWPEASSRGGDRAGLRRAARPRPQPAAAAAGVNTKRRSSRYFTT
jgi:hypothetical protein